MINIKYKHLIPSNMKIFAFVDMHGSLKALEKLVEKIKSHKPDMIVCAGDITIFEQRLDYFIERLSSFKVPFLIIPGNHESENELRKACSLFKNSYYLHKQIYEKIDGYLFMGYGGGGFGNVDKDFEKKKKKFEKKIKKKKNKKKKKKIILVTHQPPYKTSLDKLGNNYAGNKSYANFIKSNKIDLVICGHLHENIGKEDKIGNTFLINPGPYGKIIDI